MRLPNRQRRRWLPTICPGTLAMCAVDWLPPDMGLAALSGRRKILLSAVGAWASMGSWRSGLTRTNAPGGRSGVLQCRSGCGDSLEWTHLLHPASEPTFRSGVWQYVSTYIRRHFSTGCRSYPVPQLIVPVQVATPDPKARFITSSRRVNPSGRLRLPIRSPSMIWRSGTT